MNDNINFTKKKLPISPDILSKLLDNHNIKFKLYNHKPLYSVKESKIEQELIFPINSNSVHIKNLFLRDKKKKLFNYMWTR